MPAHTPTTLQKVKPTDLLRTACHEHTTDIDNLDGSNFFNVPEYLYPEWLHKLAAETKKPARTTLSECIRYRNSMAFQKKRLEATTTKPERQKGLKHANA